MQGNIVHPIRPGGVGAHLMSGVGASARKIVHTGVRDTSVGRVLNHEPADKHSGIQGKANIGSPTYQEGRRLLVAVEQSGDKADASAAVSIFRTALAETPEEPSFHNGLGEALLALARLEPHDRALEALTEAVYEFGTAGALALDQAAPAAVRIRYSINQATSLWMLGERADNRKPIEQAVDMLGSVLKDLSPESLVDWPQAQDSLGNALMALGRTTEAISAYEAATQAGRDPHELALTQVNLGTAYVDAQRYPEAILAYRKALQYQTRNRRPLAWGRTQHNLGTALWLEADPWPSSEKQLKQLNNAIKTLEAARGERRRDRSPVDWAVTTTNLASALVSLGVSLLSDPHREPSTGSRCIERAITLYKEALTDLRPTDAVRVAGMLFLVIEPLKSSPNALAAAEIVQQHQRDVLDISRRIGHTDIIHTSSCTLLNTLIEILFLLLRDIFPDHMDKLSSTILEIFDVLSSSGLGRDEWPAALRVAIEQISSSPAGLAKAVQPAAVEVARPADRRKRTSKQQPLPELPAGLEWPTDTFSEAHRLYGWDIVQYLDERWLSLLKAGVATRRILAARDPSAITAIKNFSRADPRTGQRRQLPPRLHFPTSKEINDLALSGGITVIKDDPRLAQVVASRVRQRIKVPGL